MQSPTAQNMFRPHQLHWAGVWGLLSYVVGGLHKVVLL